MSVNAGDIVQVTNDSHHWFGCLIVVTEPRGWGVIGYITIPNNEREKPNGDAFIRLNNEDFEIVGHAVLVRASEDDSE